MKILNNLSKREQSLIFILSCLLIVFVYIVYWRNETVAKINFQEEQANVLNKEIQNLMNKKNIQEKNNVNSLDIYQIKEQYNKPISKYLEGIQENINITNIKSEGPIQEGDLFYKDNTINANSSFEDLIITVDKINKEGLFLRSLTLNRTDINIFDYSMTLRSYSDNESIIFDYSKANQKVPLEQNDLNNDSLLKSIYQDHKISNIEENKIKGKTKEVIVKNNKDIKGTNDKSRAATSKKVEKRPDSTKSYDRTKQKKEHKGNNYLENSFISKSEITKSEIESDTKIKKNLNIYNDIMTSKFFDPIVGLKTDKELYPNAIFNNVHFSDNRNYYLNSNILNKFYNQDDNLLLKIDEELYFEDLNIILNGSSEVLYLEYFTYYSDVLNINLKNSSNEINIKIPLNKGKWDYFIIDLPTGLGNHQLISLSTNDNKIVEIRNMAVYEPQI